MLGCRASCAAEKCAGTLIARGCPDVASTSQPYRLSGSNLLLFFPSVHQKQSWCGRQPTAYVKLNSRIGTSGVLSNGTIPLKRRTWRGDAAPSVPDVLVTVSDSVRMNSLTVDPHKFSRRHHWVLLSLFRSRFMSSMHSTSPMAIVS